MARSGQDHRDRVPVWVQPSDRALVQGFADLCETTTATYGHPVFNLTPPSTVTMEPPPENSFVQGGTCWNITYGPETVHLTDCLGVRCIALLISAPYQHVSVIELSMRARDTETTLAPILMSQSSEIIDQEAVTSVLEKARQLQEEADEARALGQEEREEALRSQIDELVDGVQSTRGKRGTGRRFVDTVERARQAVHKNVRRSCHAIGKQAPRLGSHFGQCISISRYCSYSPATETRWIVHFSPTPSS